MARDNQRQRVYNAQRDLPEYHQLMTWPEVEAFCQKVNDSVWFRSRWVITVRPVLKRGGSAYGYGGGRITLPAFARNPIVILHEIAHTVRPAGPDVAAHGPEFCGIFLGLVRHFLGAETGRQLRQNMRTHRVRVRVAALPSARRQATPTAERRKAASAARSLPLQPVERELLVRLLRQAAASGALGPAGRKPRAQALAIARTIEKR